MKPADLKEKTVEVPGRGKVTVREWGALDRITFKNRWEEIYQSDESEDLKSLRTMALVASLSVVDDGALVYTEDEAANKNQDFLQTVFEEAWDLNGLGSSDKGRQKN